MDDEHEPLTVENMPVPGSPEWYRLPADERIRLYEEWVESKYGDPR